MTRAAVEGLPELKAALETLSRGVRKAVLERALRKAAAPLADAMRAYAPYDDGQLERSIIVSSDVASLATLAGNRAYQETMSAGGGEQAAREAWRQASKGLGGQYSANVAVGPRHHASPHAHWVEFGTGPRFQKSGKYVGVMPADPFMRPAWDANRGRMLDIISQQLRAEIDASAARSARRAARKG